MRKPSLTSLLFFFLIFVLSVPTSTLLAQGARVRASADPDRVDAEAQESDGDNPGAREEWFRSGRQAAGEHAADLLHRAYRQKMQMSASQQGGTEQPGTSLSTASPGQDTANGIPFTGPTYAGTWTSLGPAPITSDPSQQYGKVVGRVTSVAVDQGDTTGNTVYIGAAFGGAWKSTNAAASSSVACTQGSGAACVQWTPLIDNQPTLAVGAITVQPGTTGNSAVVLIGTGEPNSSGDSYYGMGILRSIDGGKTWAPIIKNADNGAKTFTGLGASKFAWNGNTVVVGMGSTNGKRYGSDSVGGRGIYYSQDAGATWHYASVQDPGSATLTEGTVTDIAFNAGTGKFYAFYRYHGLYESADGISWTRSIQPEATPGTQLILANCPTNQPTPNPTGSCPLYRGQIAIQPTTHDMYVIYVSDTDINQGIFIANVSNGVLTAWRQLSSQGSSTSPAGAKIATSPLVDTTSTNQIVQGDYNLWIGAVPNGAGTDLLVGTRNVYKCSLSASVTDCTTWLDLTHVYTCNPTAAPSQMHPDQHGFDFNLGNPLQMYFVNDGGVYRALNGTSISTGACTSPNPFDNLDTNMGSLSEMVSFSQHPTNQNVLLSGLQDNGSPALLGSGAPLWTIVNGGDGGYNEIDPNNPDGIWYTENTGVSIQQCDATNKQASPNGPGIATAEACTPGTFGLPPYSNGGSQTSNIGSPQVASDKAEFYMPYILDPANTANLIVGTCRLWRGPGVGGGTWVDPTVGANKDISPFFDTTNASCGNGTTKIRSIAAGGANVNGASQVIYVGLEGAGTSTDSGANLGHVFVNKNAATLTHSANGGWLDVTGNIAATLSTSGGTYGPYPVSSIEVDRHDATGQTAYVTVEGFGVSHVFKTTNAGASWADLTSNLPDAPVDSIAIDPDDQNVLYLGTDVGAFISLNAGTSWQILGTNLPNVPVTKIRVFGSNATQPKLLRVSTYGRGVWQFALPLPPPADLSPASISFPNQVVKTTGAAQTVTFTNNSSSAIAISGVALATGTDFAIKSNGCGTSLAALAACQIQITFTPQATGQRNDTLTVTNSASTVPQSVALAGTGVASALAISPASLSFSSTFVGTTSAAQTITVVNSGTASVGITVGNSPANFNVVNNCGTSVAGSGSCTVVVTFVPAVPSTGTASGTLTGTLAITDSSSGVVNNIALSGQPSDFGIAATGATGNSQTVNSGQPASYSLALSSVNGFAGNVSLACSGLPTGTACTFNPPSPVSVPAGGTTVALSISTTSHSASQPAPTAGLLGIPPGRIPPGGLLLITLSLAILIGLSRLKLLKAPARAFAMSALLGVLTLAPGCGGGGGGSITTTPSPITATGTPAGTYTVTVTATSGNRSQTTQLTLKVN